MFMPSGCIKTLVVLNHDIVRCANLLDKAISNLVDELQGGISKDNKASVVLKTQHVTMALEAIKSYGSHVEEEIRFLRERAKNQ